MAVTCASVRKCHPNLASARLLNQINLVHVKRNAIMMMIVKETRSAAPMAVVMSVLPQNTKVCCSDISTYKLVMLVLRIMPCIKTIIILLAHAHWLVILALNPGMQPNKPKYRATG